jgi:hypothetical protein
MGPSFFLDLAVPEKPFKSFFDNTLPVESLKIISFAKMGVMQQNKAKNNSTILYIQNFL